MKRYCDVKNETMEEWLDTLPAVCSGYSPENIFNMDETGLFNRATTKNTSDHIQQLFLAKFQFCSLDNALIHRLTP
jgi:hypothetical protein